MSNDYIRRDDAVDAVRETFKRIPTTAIRAMDSIKALPSADVAPVVHGRWIKYTGMGKVQWMCSECSAEEKNPKVANYCYHCGAKMDGERKE